MAAIIMRLQPGTDPVGVAQIIVNAITENLPEGADPVRLHTSGQDSYVRTEYSFGTGNRSTFVASVSPEKRIVRVADPVRPAWDDEPNNWNTARVAMRDQIVQNLEPHEA